MIRAVLFDMDGILYDSEWYYMRGTVAQMRSYGYTGPEEAIYQIIGTTMAGTYQILYDLLDHRIPIAELQRNNEHYFNDLHPIPYRQIMFPGVPAALREIRSTGHRMAVCSSSPILTIEQSLDAMGIRPLFDFVESGDRVRHPKPDPEIYLLAASSLGVPPEQCIVYEDSTTGIEAGRRAGIFTVARQDLRFHQDQSHADKIVKDIQELCAWIRKEDDHAGSH